MQKTIPDRSEKFAYIQKCRNHGGGISNHTECLPKFSRLLTFKIIKRTANFFFIAIKNRNVQCTLCMMCDAKKVKWYSFLFSFYLVQLSESKQFNSTIHWHQQTEVIDDALHNCYKMHF